MLHPALEQNTSEVIRPQIVEYFNHLLKRPKVTLMYCQHEITIYDLHVVGEKFSFIAPSILESGYDFDSGVIAYRSAVRRIDAHNSVHGCSRGDMQYYPDSLVEALLNSEDAFIYHQALSEINFRNSL
jgi:hypothetical protein